MHLAAVGLFATFEETTPEEFSAGHRREPHGAGLRGDGRGSERSERFWMMP